MFTLANTWDILSFAGLYVIFEFSWARIDDFSERICLFVYLFCWVSRRWINIMEATINSWWSIRLENAQVFTVWPLQYHIPNHIFLWKIIFFIKFLSFLFELDFIERMFLISSGLLTDHSLFPDQSITLALSGTLIKVVFF